jgi:sortase A
MKERRAILWASGFLLILGTATVAHSLEAIEAPGVASAGEFFLPALAFSPTLVKTASQPVPKVGELIATLEIPRLKRTIKVYEGTQSAQLKLGAGHFVQSVLPGYRDNSVIAGHRDSVFSQFGSLKRGDLLKISTNYGKFTYVIVSLKVVAADDKTVIVSTEHSRLTLSTCFPFRFIGNAPQRFIVGANLAKPIS